MGDGEQRTGSSIGRVLAVQAVAYVVLFGVTGVLEFTFGNQGGVAQGVAIALAWCCSCYSRLGGRSVPALPTA